jgi:hypothetical protein
LAVCTGCTTKAAKKALNEPTPTDNYSGFDANKKKASERKRSRLEPVSHDMNPEKAVEILVDHMQRQEHHYRIPAEQQLRIWATKQGVAEMIVQRIKVLMLLKNPKIEVRAPALRLTIAYGKADSTGDLIEVLTDPDYGMRSTAFKALRMKFGRDFGYNPAGGELARQQAIDAWRRWWQAEQRSHMTGQGPIPEIKRTKPPELIEPKGNAKRVPEEEGASSPGETVLPPPKPKK